MIKPCIECGQPSTSTRCPEHRREHRSRQRGSARARGYDTTWDKLSRRARALQPFCSDCHGTEDLTTDHFPSAWQRKAEGKAIRLADVDVMCGPCNTRRGSSRPSATEPEIGAETQAGSPVRTPSGPGGKAKRPSHSGSEVGGTNLTTADLDPSMRRVVDHFVAVADDQDTVVSDLEVRAVGVVPRLGVGGEGHFERHARSLS